MGSTSALNTLRKLSTEIPYSVKKGEEYTETLRFLHELLPFGLFAIAKATPSGELPADQYFASAGFPVFNPRTLETAIKQKQSQVESFNQILMVPCLNGGSSGNDVVGVLLAHHIPHESSKPHHTWLQSELLLIEVAAQELGRILSPTLPGLTISPNLKSKNRGFSNQPPTFIGHSEKLKTILQMIDRVAPTTASVLILGESGTGKELISRRIHALSDRAEAPFVAINCGAISENLLESELFGHEKGSFTGASVQKKGLVEIANGGTLFLDEIGEMPLSLQAKLLRFLQEGDFYRVGGKESIHVEVRIVSATNRDLENEVRTGKFREDLYYRLNTISIKSPALRERKEDVPILIEHFSPGTMTLFTPEAIEALKSYSWPGNIRELQNIIERLRILSGGGLIGVQDLPHSIKNAKQGLDLNMTGAPPVEMTLDDLERIHILRCLNHFEGNKTRAAQSLGITIKTLYNKLHRYGILDKTEANV